ncbi:MAG: radical SAM protein, partial [bacterium]
KGKKIIKTKERKLVENLDDLPFVSEIYLRHFGEKQIKEYFYASINWPEIQILTARGCPNGCSFCNIPMKKSYRTRSIENVIKEFKFIQENMPFLNEIMLEDDTFPADKQRTIDLCNAMIKEGIKFTWSTNARVNTDLETLQKMKQAGCRLVCVGFETPTQNVLNNILKGQTKNMQVDFKKRADQAGILVNGCFILGLPSDTPETMQATIDFAKFLNPNTAQFYPLMIYPGTTAYKWAKENNFVSTEDYRKWITKEGLHNTVINRPELSAEELVKWCNKARIEFYAKNPKYWLKMIKQVIKNPKEGIRIAKGGTILIKHLGKSILSNDSKVKK